ncbi:MAG: universal stress protein [Actinomycetota bacterium]|nr:universal stress protein [Actinomycetota bacterium]
MERLLIGIDGSETARQALGWASDLARRSGAELAVSRVFVPNQSEVPPVEWDALRDQQVGELRELCAALENPPATVSTAMLDGDPAEALLRAAGDPRADLLVVGGRGAGGFPHLHLGSVAHHLIHHARTPIAVVPDGGAAPLTHLVVGVDGSPASLAAVELCAELADDLGVDVTAIHAFEPVAEWVSPTDPSSWHHRALDEMAQWTAPMEKAGVPVSIDVQRELHPVDALARTLSTRPGSAAVVGGRGLGGFTGLRLGRVPIQLLHHAGSPVIVVPGDDG